jgi:integrase/recombinase XerD
MACQFVREPLNSDEVNRLCHACETMQEKMIVWVLLDSGLRVGKLCSLTPQNILWQEKSLRISGKDGPYGSLSKKTCCSYVKTYTSPFGAILFTS